MTVAFKCFPECCSAFILTNFYDPEYDDDYEDEGEETASTVKIIQDQMAVAKRQGNWTVGVAVLVRRQVSAIAAFRELGWYESNKYMRKTYYSKGNGGQHSVEDDEMDKRDTILFFMPMGDEVD